MTQEKMSEMCDRVRETAFALHACLRHGHKEQVHENGLCHRLRKQGLAALQQPSLTVCDEDGTPLGDLDIDLIVADELVIELKAAKAIVNEHIAQLSGCLRASRKEHGLLVNFGAPHLQIRKFALSQDIPQQTPPLAPLCASSRPKNLLTAAPVGGNQ